MPEKLALSADQFGGAGSMAQSHTLGRTTFQGADQSFTTCHSASNVGLFCWTVVRSGLWT